MTETQMEELLSALRNQASVQTALGQSIERLALSNEQLVAYLKSREPDPDAPPYLDGSKPA
ncbi:MULTISPECIES: hypothetical protein [unclassified Pseudomonas]|uniref:hypothetical protein n=1 Tax=unclassified Pseudomonas TaxID=196821 RepID=UPI00244BB234|nr:MULTISPECIES: hypothetical protein [unclassified Pseudomonas]MDH0300604.1 hypothetical protein [Pseudomonas sp. GD04091]MDH1984245.1 hypothetical protein [Pseudomonas sp. GD03689]